MKKIIWDRLKSLRCPKCNKPIEDVPLTHLQMEDLVMPYYRCTGKKCDFSINKERFDQVVADLYKPRIYRR